MSPEFKTHILTEAGIEKAVTIGVVFDTLLVTLTGGFDPICRPCRETSILKTKLEEACFYAKKAMAKANQE